MTTTNYDKKHLTTTQRIKIEDGLNRGLSMVAIGRMIEKNHQYIREVIPKGKSLDLYNQKDATLLMNHINSEARDSLNGCTPFKLSQMLLNSKLHSLLKLVEIAPDQVTLKPTLLKK